MLLPVLAHHPVRGALEGGGGSGGGGRGRGGGDENDAPPRVTATNESSSTGSSKPLKSTKRCACGCQRLLVEGSRGHKLPGGKYMDTRIKWLRTLDEYRSLKTEDLSNVPGGMTWHPDHFLARGDAPKGIGRYWLNGSFKLDRGVVPFTKRELQRRTQQATMDRESPLDRATHRALEKAKNVIDNSESTKGEAIIALADVAARFAASVKREKKLEQDKASGEKKIHEQAKKIQELEREREELEEEVEHIKENQKFPLRAVHLHTTLASVLNQLTGFNSAAAFDAFYKCLNSDGVVENAVRIYRGDRDDDGKIASAQAGTKIRLAARALHPKDAIFFTLMALRTGIDMTLLCGFFGIAESTGSRYFTTYVCFLSKWLAAEFPYPTELQIFQALPAKIKQKCIPYLGPAAAENLTEIPIINMLRFNKEAIL